MSLEKEFHAGVHSILPVPQLMPEPYRAAIVRCDSEPIRRGDEVEIWSGDGSANVGGGTLRIAYILRARSVEGLNVDEHEVDILDMGRNGILLLTGPPAALATLRPNTTLRGTHAPVTDGEIRAALRPVAA